MVFGGSPSSPTLSRGCLDGFRMVLGGFQKYRRTNFQTAPKGFSEGFQDSNISGWDNLFFVLFVLSSTVLFGGVLWSKFAHMFFKPAAAFQKRVTEADGSRENLPAPADRPEQFGLGIKREAPKHY